MRRKRIAQRLHYPAPITFQGGRATRSITAATVAEILKRNRPFSHIDRRSAHMIDFNRTTPGQKLIILLGLFYFLSPIRLLINLIPLIGDVADVFVIVFLIAIYRA
jgi:uncharacterized membrane protein YkvA (DUF1232 family)